MCGIIIIVLRSLEMSLEINSATVCERLCWLNPFELFISLPLTDKSSNYLSFLKKTSSLSQDKQGIPWWLGISYKGIGQYDLQDKLKPRKVCFCFSLVLRALYKGSVVMEKILWIFLGSNS